MKNCDLIIKGKYILPMDDKLSVIKDGFVAVSKNKISAVGAVAEMKDFKTKEIIDAGNSIIMPGLINTHTHAAMTYFRGLADDLPLDIWLNKHIWPAEAKYVNAEFVKQAGELACLEMLKAGVTSYNDMYFFGQAMAEPAEKSNLRALIGITGIDFKDPDSALEEAVKLSKQYKNNEFIKIVLAPHAIYTCSKDNLLKIKAAAEAENLRVHIHVSETKKEVDDCLKNNGKSPVEYLDELGLLSEKLIAAHSVWLSGSDLEIYKNRGVKVAHCPISNMKLASGAAPLKRMLEMGITVGLGTDGAASNNTLDLFSDMRACALLHKVNNYDPTAVSAKEVIKMATIDGAKVLGREKEIGSLEIGKKADIITINLNKPHLTPIYDPYSHLVYCVNGEDVENVVVNGKVIMENREVKTLDEEKILKQAGEFKI
ncbi:MAG: amidohydrolase [Patescibacteria group bacterium]|jgi:5-methylthioadenosine/S-adenosylhomocysteine deaminase